MIRNHGNGDARLVILVIQEVFKVFPGFTAQRHPYTGDLRIDAVDGFHNGIVLARVHLGRRLVFAVNFVENFPIVDLVVMAGVVALAEFIREPALRVPTDQAARSSPPLPSCWDHEALFPARSSRLPGPDRWDKPRAYRS